MGVISKNPVTIQQIHHNKHDEGDWHYHQSGQFFFITKGLLVLETPEGRQAMLSKRAGWIPPRCTHKATYHGDVQAITFYFDKNFCDELPTKTCAFTPTSLLFEVINRLFQKGADIQWTKDNVRLLQVMKDELKTMQADPLFIPMPTGQRLGKLAQAFIDEPSQVIPLDGWAAKANMSKRTFTRHFREQTGVSFAKWCQQVRIMQALERLANGEAVSLLAFNLGYNSVSAFIKVFNHYIGQTPNEYKKNL